MKYQFSNNYLKLLDYLRSCPNFDFIIEIQGQLFCFKSADFFQKIPFENQEQFLNDCIKNEVRYIDPDNYVSNVKLRDAIFQNKQYQKELVQAIDKLNSQNLDLKRQIRKLKVQFYKIKKKLKSIIRF